MNKEFQFKIGNVWLDVMADSPGQAVAKLNEALPAFEESMQTRHSHVERVCLDFDRDAIEQDIFQVFDPETGDMTYNESHPSKTNPPNAAICDACDGQRWLVFFCDGRTGLLDGYYVLRCDECSSESLNDGDGIKMAKEAGLKCADNGHVEEEEVQRWMALYPNRGIIPKHERKH